jgi:glutamine synthetase
MAFLAPYVNSYRRLVRHAAAPINIRWGRDNRTVGIRVPRSTPEARRIENRVIGADANPYVAMAVTLACGYLGMKERLEPSEEATGNAYGAPYELPRSMSEALNLLAGTPELAGVLGERFATIYRLVKELEYDEFMQVISSWEREHLLLHV